jgi:MarR family transcriptional regulator, transcriptional regulator for hemolysin
MTDIRDIWVYANNILRSSRQMINDELIPLGLSSSEGNILFHLLTQGGGAAQEELVELLDISKPAVSRALEALEGKGYITRQAAPLDRRAKQVIVTQKARQIQPQVEGIYHAVFALASQEVSEDEIYTFIEIFRKVSERFTAAREQKSTPLERDSR